MLVVGLVAAWLFCGAFERTAVRVSSVGSGSVGLYAGGVVVVGSRGDIEGIGEDG